jgi:hypothetical protein
VDLAAGQPQADRASKIHLKDMLFPRKYMQLSADHVEAGHHRNRITGSKHVLAEAASGKAAHVTSEAER